MQKNGNPVVRVKIFNKLQIRTFHKRARVTRICLDSRSEVRGGIGPQGLRNCNKKITTGMKYTPVSLRDASIGLCYSLGLADFLSGTQAIIITTNDQKAHRNFGKAGL